MIKIIEEYRVTLSKGSGRGCPFIHRIKSSVSGVSICGYCCFKKFKK